jgi:hypothetical protein
MRPKFETRGVRQPSDAKGAEYLKTDSLRRGNVDKMTPQVKMTPIEIFNVFELSAFLNREVT